MITAAQLAVEVKADGVDSAKSQLSGMGGFVDSIGSGFKSSIGGALSFAAGLAGQALNFLKDQFIDSVRVAMDHQQVLAQTVQALKSTRDASGMTAQSIDDLALSLSQVTPFAEDTVQSGENLLLTFTGIGKQVFPEATQAMLDMAQAMHQGPQAGAIMLGKALNDPLTGLTALTRVGVTFSDEEKKQIKLMMAHNDIIGAQKIMLHELETEFGGSAKAAGQTFGGQLQILQNRLEDVKVKIGTAVLPILSDLLSFVESNLMPILDSFAGWFSQVAIPAIESTAPYFKMLGDDFLTLGQHLSQYLAPALHDVMDLFSSFGGASKGINLGGLFKGLDFSAVGDAFETIDGYAKQFGQGLDAVIRQITPTIKEVSGIIGGQLSANFKFAVDTGKQLSQWWHAEMWPAIQQALPGFEHLANTLMTDVVPGLAKLWAMGQATGRAITADFLPVFEKAYPILVRIYGIIAEGLSQALKFLMPYALQAGKALSQFAEDIAARVVPILMNFWNAIQKGLDWLQANWKYIWPSLSSFLQGIWNVIVGILKIAWAVITGIVKVGLDLISGNWGQAWTDIKDMFKGIWDGIVTMLKGFVDMAWGMISGFVTGIIGFFQGLYDQLVGHSIIPDMINGIISWFGQLPGRAMAFISSLVSQLTGTLGNLGSMALGWAQDMIGGFVDGIKGGIGAVGNAIAGVADKVRQFLHFSKPDVGPLADVDTWMPDFTDLLSKGLLAGVPKLHTALGQLTAPIANSLNPGASGFGGSSSMPYSFPLAQSAPQIVVNVAPELSVDGRRLTNILMPHLATAIRYNTGTMGV